MVFIDLAAGFFSPKCQKRGRGGRKVWGSSAAPERSAGEKRRRSASFKENSRKVYNYSTKTNLFGIDCSARRVRRAPQGKIRFCFRREIPEFTPITI